MIKKFEGQIDPAENQDRNNPLGDPGDFEWPDIESLSSIEKIGEAIEKVKEESQRYSEWFNQVIDGHEESKIDGETYRKLSKRYDNIGLNIATALEKLEDKKRALETDNE